MTEVVFEVHTREKILSAKINIHSVFPSQNLNSHVVFEKLYNRFWYFTREIDVFYASTRDHFINLHNFDLTLVRRIFSIESESSYFFD